MLFSCKKMSSFRVYTIKLHQLQLDGQAETEYELMVYPDWENKILLLFGDNRVLSNFVSLAEGIKRP